MEGSVSFQPDGVNDWVDASVNRPLIPGDSIWVGDRGRTEFHVGSTALRLGPNTAFQFLNLDDQGVQIRLSEGTLTVRIRNFSPNQFFEIDTPNLAFTALRPGEYRIEANPDSQTTTVIVRDGEGEVTGGGEAFPLYARQRVIVRGDDQITYNLAAAPGLDAFDQWCSTRDRREDQLQSVRYVSREMTGYEDLDQYGRWDNQPGYGSVWMPTSVSVGWAPYHDGHWAWIAPWGWTWVDDAPWGFAPYHYGRWASFNGRWGWIPGPYGVTPVYAPALVAWVGGGRGGSGFSLSFSFGTAAAIGWFALGPREPYFPSYQVSQGYFARVNSTNTVINNTTINNYYDYSRNANTTAVTNITYVNRNVQNSVTAVPQDAFAKGRRVAQDARAVPSAQLASTQVFGAPAIAPQREGVLGARADTASRAARPPAKTQSRPVVARTAPPPGTVPFDRQQKALTENPGRPLAGKEAQQLRQGAAAPSAPVRVVDMNRVKRVQPAVGATPQDAPATVERQKGKGASQPAITQPQNAPPEPQRRQPQATPPQVAQPQAPITERQKGKATPPQVAAPQPSVVEQQKGQGQQRREQQATPAQAPQPQAPVTERQKGPPAQAEPQQPAAVPQTERAQPEATPAAPKQNKGKGKQQKSDDSKNKSDK